MPGVPAPLGLAAAVGGAYALGSQIAYSWFNANGLFASFFPAAGVTLAALVLTSRRRWPIVLAAAGTAEVAVDLAHGLGIEPSLGYAAANLAQPLLGALLLDRLGGRPDLGRLRGLAAFFACAVVAGPALGAVLGASTFVGLDDGTGWLRFAGEWWAGDGLGVLVVGSAILCAHALRARVVAGEAVPPRLAVEAGALAAGAGIATVAVFWWDVVPLVFLPVVVLLVLAFRAGAAGVVLAATVVSFVAAEATSSGHHFWRSLDVSTSVGMLYLQGTLALLLVVSLVVAAVVAERARALVAHAGAEAARRESERASRHAARVRQLAERVSVAATPQAVGEAFLAEALAQVGGLAGVLMLVSGEDGPLELSAMHGDLAVGRQWLRTVPREERFVVAAAFASARPVVAASRADLERRFPASAASFGPRVRAAVGLRVVAFGHPIGAFAVAFGREVELRADDLTLLETMASVCGPALERARLFEREHEARLRAEQLQSTADDAARGRSEALDELREREARFQTLFSSIDEGYCLCEMVLDASGRAVDYRFLEVNRRFEEQTGLVGAVGRTALELVPGLEPYWVETYARVGLGGETIRFENGSEQMDRWFDVYAAPVDPVGSGRFVLVFSDATERRRAELELRRSEEAERRARRRAELLAEIHAELELVEGARARIERAVELLVPRVADYATIEAPEREDALLALAHRDAALQPVLAELRTSQRLGPGEARAAAAESHRPTDLAALGADEGAPGSRSARLLARLEVRSQAAAPLDLGLGETGVLLVGLSDPARRPYKTEDVEFLGEIAQRLGALVARARLQEEAGAVSRRLQLALLPDRLLGDPALELAARYRPGSDGLEVGGDWYDAFPLADGRVGLAVGDVVGHGLEAAAAMGRLRTALVALAPHADGPGQLLSLLDDFAAGSNGADFATACVASLDPATGVLRYASAGHPPPLVVSLDGSTRWLADGRSTPLCGLGLGERGDAGTVLEPGDLLVLCSDGLIERRGESLDDGLARLAATAAGLVDASADAACDRLLAAAAAHAPGDDDVVVLCVRFAPVETRRFRRSLPAAAGELAALRADARAWLVDRGHTIETQQRLLLALGEVVTNAIEHAYVGDAPGVVDVAIVDDGDSIGVEVRDYGRWRPPSPAVPGRGSGTDILDALGERVVCRTGREGTTVSFAVPVAVAVGA